MLHGGRAAYHEVPVVEVAERFGVSRQACSLLTGARTAELRALTWAHVDLDGRPADIPPIPPSVHVWLRSRFGGDTKTRKSRRTPALPAGVRPLSPRTASATATRPATCSCSPPSPELP